MSTTETTETTSTETAETDATSTETDTTDTTEAEGTTGADAEGSLGDAGKKALDAMKAKWKAAEATAKENATALAELKAKADGQEAEFKAATEAQKVKDEAIAAANDRIKKAEVRAAAAGKLNDPKDALLHLDLSEFEVSSDGEVDASAIATAIDDLIKEKPYLAAQGKRFTGSADGGARNDASAKSQLTRDEMKRMSPEQIDAAEKEGRFNELLGRK